MSRRFESLFQRDGLSAEGKPRFRITGSGVQTQPTDAPATCAIVNRLEREGMRVTSSSMGSAASSNCYKLIADFIDGGLRAETGNYWMSKRGAWIEGEEAVAWLANKLGLRPPGSLRLTRRPSLPAELEAAYVATDFVAFATSEPIHVAIGQPIPTALAALMDTHRSESAAIVTAWNPFGRNLSEGANRLRQMQFLHELRSLGLYWIAAEGRDPKGEHTTEESALVFGVSRESASTLLQRYQQHALVWMTRDDVAQLMYE